MKKGLKAVYYMLLFSGCLIALILIMQPLLVYHFADYIEVLFPKGIIGMRELHLLLIIQGIMLLVIIPVFVLTFIFSWKYSAENPKGKYDPDLVDNVGAEVLWWGIPLVLTAIVAVLTGIRTYQLDPYKPIVSDQKPMTIQVVALQWKWLFIYPEENIATVNFIHIPVNRPIHFEITADAPMNSFWIPALGGQIYAMPNMRTNLHLIANEAGDFRGSSANISGEGFAEMHFITRATGMEEYQKWVQKLKDTPHHLDFKEYEKLAKPSVNEVAFYQVSEDKLFNQILMKYMHVR